MHPKKEMSIELSYHAVKLPPIRDILVLGNKMPQGKLGVMESIRFVAPDEFMLINLEDEKFSHISAIIVNKNILKRIEETHLITILAEHVFPYLGEEESFSVDLNIHTTIQNITLIEE